MTFYTVIIKYTFLQATIQTLCKTFSHRPLDFRQLAQVRVFWHSSDSQNKKNKWKSKLHYAGRVKTAGKRYHSYLVTQTAELTLRYPARSHGDNHMNALSMLNFANGGFRSAP